MSKRFLIMKCFAVGIHKSVDKSRHEPYCAMLPAKETLELRLKMTSYLEVFHQHSDYYIDQHKLCHQYENNKKQRSNDSVDAAVCYA